MHALGTVFIDVIVGLFFLGMAGSAIVVVISFVEDSQELFGPDEPALPAHSKAPAPTIQVQPGH